MRKHASVSLPALGLIGLVRLYRLTISPVIGVRCRHEPSCSAFALDAMRRHGAWAGGWITLARLIRCRPGGSWGWDPAPEHIPENARWWAPWRYGDWGGGFRAPPTHDDDLKETHA
jgi:putative membrane protein insertion efficiency factor